MNITINAFVARDLSGELYYFEKKPKRDAAIWIAQKDTVWGELPKEKLQEVKWEDEPRQIELTIKIL